MGCFHSGFRDRAAAFERGTAARATGLLHLNNARPCGKRCLCEISKRNRSVCTRLIRRSSVATVQRASGEMSWRENERKPLRNRATSKSREYRHACRTVSILSYEGGKTNFSPKLPASPRNGHLYFLILDSIRGEKNISFIF